MPDHDGLAQKPSGTYEGIEIKSGGADLTPNQRPFDDAVSYDSPTTTTINGQAVQITSSVTRYVP